jgi:chemotaxis protein MotB
MARRKIVEEPENHDRWLVSYADFITLLFAFFVVMYSISSVNEGQYKVLSDSMITAFTPSSRSPANSQMPDAVQSHQSQELVSMTQTINLAPLVIARRSENPVLVDPDAADNVVRPEVQEEESVSGEVDQMNEIALQIEGALESSIASGEVIVERTPFWLEVVFNSSLLFESGSALLEASGELVLQSLGQELIGLPNAVTVEGFTDNIPISSTLFPSNWELSSSRASAVVRLFERRGVESARLSSVGFGETRPISINSSEQGRARNRRVVVVIMAELEDQVAGQSGSLRLIELLRQGQDSN